MQITKEMFKKDYPLLGPLGFSEKYNITRRRAIGKAFEYGIKFKNKKHTYCLGCGKETFGSKGYCSNSLSGLCRNCSADRNYKNRGAFTHHDGNLFSDDELKILKAKFYDSERGELCKILNRSWNSIKHKALRLKLKRNPKFKKRAVIERNLNNNPMKNPISKNKAHDTLKKLYQDHPEMLLNSRLKRNQMTLIERKVAELLDSLNINYEWNKFVRTKLTWRFPDFKVGNLVIECDGEYWHSKIKDEDEARQKELEAVGFKVIRFSDKQILNNFEEVSKCIQQELNQ